MIPNHVAGSGMKCIPLAKPMLFWNQELYTHLVNFSAHP